MSEGEEISACRKVKECLNICMSKGKVEVSMEVESVYLKTSMSKSH